MGEDQELVFHAKISIESHRSKKNFRPIFRNSRTGRTFLGKSSKLKSAEEYLLLQLQSLKNRLKISQPIGYDVRAMFIFGFSDYYTKKGIRSRTLPDLSNLVELPQDCMQKSGILENDTFICSLDGSRRVPSDHNFLEIFLYRFLE